MLPAGKDNHEATKIAKKKTENMIRALALYPLLRVLRGFVVDSVAEVIFRAFLSCRFPSRHSCQPRTSGRVDKSIFPAEMKRVAPIV